FVPLFDTGQDNQRFVHPRHWVIVFFIDLGAPLSRDRTAKTVDVQHKKTHVSSHFSLSPGRGLVLATSYPHIGLEWLCSLRPRYLMAVTRVINCGNDSPKVFFHSLFKADSASARCASKNACTASCRSVSPLRNAQPISSVGPTGNSTTIFLN